jgi:hypothetical protein
MQNEKRSCLTCGKEFAIPAAAPHKKFCTRECRQKWHYAARLPGQVQRLPLPLPAAFWRSVEDWLDPNAPESLREIIKQQKEIEDGK